jgi:hypothetical protein
MPGDITGRAISGFTATVLVLPANASNNTHHGGGGGGVIGNASVPSVYTQKQSNFTVTVSNQSFSATPGEAFHSSLNITNNASVPQDFNITADSPLLTIEQPTVHLGPKESTAVPITFATDTAGVFIIKVTIKSLLSAEQAVLNLLFDASVPAESVPPAQEERPTAIEAGSLESIFTSTAAFERGLPTMWYVVIAILEIALALFVAGMHGILRGRYR